MKKIKTMRIASILLIAVLMTTCAISGTFAKYVTEATGSDSARVAKWDIKLEDAKMVNSFTFDLFNTVMDTDGQNETDISVSDGTIIAPGTKGSFEINLKNDSEVNAKYAINYTLQNPDNIPVKFSVDGTNWYTDINYIDVSEVALNMNATAAVTVQWMWEFEAGADAYDTTLGEGGVSVLSVAAVITVEQVD